VCSDMFMRVQTGSGGFVHVCVGHRASSSVPLTEKEQMSSFVKKYKEPE
jgi:hypothetical protein